MAFCQRGSPAIIADDKFVVAVGGEQAITTRVVQDYQQA
ncbi:hypothetical protein MiAbB_04920 [Microcystis aeruginosa NIES-4285]|uniref:Uncharacterized protein n=1 Tax=Microcystis aeruginosa NIES-4285 TaxID=2497681 RepID=A0A402DL68_MICAE|nr:hypothetical protein MiAbB_04920 [Microcystis aeruginosa NIES-4285]